MFRHFILFYTQIERLCSIGQEKVSISSSLHLVCGIGYPFDEIQPRKTRQAIFHVGVNPNHFVCTAQLRSIVIQPYHVCSLNNHFFTSHNPNTKVLCLLVNWCRFFFKPFDIRHAIFEYGEFS